MVLLVLSILVRALKVAFDAPSTFLSPSLLPFFPSWQQKWKDQEENSLFLCNLFSLWHGMKIYPKEYDLVVRLGKGFMVV